MSLAQLRVEEDAQVDSQHDIDIAAIGDRASRLGIEIADIVGIIEDLGGLGRKQMETLRSAVRSASGSEATSLDVANRSARRADVTTCVMGNARRRSTTNPSTGPGGSNQERYARTNAGAGPAAASASPTGRSTAASLGSLTQSVLAQTSASAPVGARTLRSSANASASSK